eukprot:jgi/Botrbrau1/22218/Bobra.168_1s0049.1
MYARSDMSSVPVIFALALALAAPLCQAHRGLLADAACPPNSHWNSATKQCDCSGTDLFDGTACCPIFASYDTKTGKCGCIKDYNWNGQDCVYKTPNGAMRYSGVATWYNEKGVTACGEQIVGDGDFAAISLPLSNELSPECAATPEKCNWCGRKARVDGPKGSVTVRVIDLCQSCSLGDIDLSKSTFQAVLGDTEAERYPITWYFL